MQNHPSPIMRRPPNLLLPALLVLTLALAAPVQAEPIDCGDMSESQCNDLLATQKRNDKLKDEARFKHLGVEAEQLARCVLDKLPETTSDAAADSAYRACMPSRSISYADAPPRDGSFSDYIFGYGSGGTCTAKEGAKTSSARARRMIKGACEYLYGK